jgi:hypothetical protein
MRWALLLLLAACGRIGFTGLGDGGLGGGDDAPIGGGGDDAPGSTSDGPTPDGSSGVALCGSTVIVDDGFNAAGNGAFTVVNTGGYNTAKINGVYRFSVSNGATMGSRVALQTASMSLSNLCAIAELSLAPTTANVRAYLRVGLPAKNIEVYVEAGMLWGRFTVGGTTGSIGPATYSAAAMRFIRMRNVGQNYVIEYAPSVSATTWMMLGQLGGSFSDPNPSVIEIGVLAAAVSPAPTMAEFERVLILGP